MTRDLTAAQNAYAGLMRRASAYLIDALLIFTAFVASQYALVVPLRGALLGSDEWFRSGVHTEAYTLLTVSLPAWLYFGLCERSVWRGTLGKRLLGLCTVDATSGSRLGPGQALGRALAKMVPWELAHLTNNLPVPMWYDPSPGFRLGFALLPVLIGLYAVLVLLTRRRQSLQDLLANTVVLRRS